MTVEHCALDREWRYCLYGGIRPEGLGSGELVETRRGVVGTRRGESGSMVVMHEYFM